MPAVTAATHAEHPKKLSLARRHPVGVLVARRVGTSLVLLIAVSILIFIGCQILPGDAANAILGRDATPQALAALRASLHLSEPAPQRYLEWMSGILHGNLGYSATQDSQIWPLIRGRVVASLILAGVTILILIPLSLILGVLAASRAGRAADRVISGTSVALIAVPEFVSGTLLALLFGVTLSILPAVSYFPPGADPLATPAILVLPCLTLLCASVAQTLRMVRAGMVDALRSEYVATARLNGFPERTVVMRVALRNSLAPTIQVVALNLQWLVGGIVVTETLFNYPGLGQELVTAVTARDIPLVQSIALLIAVFYFAVNIVTDVLLIVVVPRLRTAR
jgi:peptide/nickel transport system permease protein